MSMELACVLFVVFSFVVWIRSVWEAMWKQNAFGVTPWLLPLGIYVWGDGVILSLYWLVLGIVSWWCGGLVFGLGAGAFWMVRSMGEVHYWMLEQFVDNKRNKPQDLFGYQWVRSEAIYFYYQLVNQVILVISGLATLYFAARIFL